MIDEKLFQKLIQQRKKTKNVLNYDVPEYSDGKTTLFMANPDICSMVQNLIDQIPEHRHLKGSNILILVKTVADQNENAAGCFARVIKAGPKDRFFACLMRDAKPESAPDFIIIFSGNALDAEGITSDGGHACPLLEVDYHKALSIIDHELLHCGAKTVADYASPSEIHDFIKDLGLRYIKTLNEFKRDSDGAVLVVYYVTDNNGYIYNIRKHDVQEFQGVIERHGESITNSHISTKIIKTKNKDLFVGK